MVLEKIIQMLSEQLNIDAETITADTRIIEDLNADSLDMVEMLMSAEDEFDVEIPDEEIEHLKTVGDVAEYIANHME